MDIVQGISYWSVTSKSALSGRKIHNFIKLWWLVGSRCFNIWVSSTSFQKSNIGWHQQPPTERVSNISKKIDFWRSISQKGTGIGHLGTRDDPTIILSKIFWWNESVEIIEATEVVEAIEVIEVSEEIWPRKSLLRTSVSSRFLNSALLWCFEEKKIG